jgi:leader peptidase (prepilin peptidase)/N-methyltransferase
MQLFSLIYGVFGLLIGSFLNVCIYRLPRSESIVFPRSHCPNCGKPIPFYDNVPVLSYLVLMGKCRFCKKPISLQYPLVELLTGLVFYGCGLKWDFSPATFVNTLFLVIVIVLAFIDFHHRILPNVLTLPGTIMGIILSPFQMSTFYHDMFSFKLASLIGCENTQTGIALVGSIAGAIIGGGILLLLAFVYELLRKKQGLGMGDVKMMAMVGAFLGWPHALLTIFAGSFLGSIIGVFLILFRGMNIQSKLAFGTFLGAGAAVSLFFGLSFFRWYLPYLF